MKCSLVVSGCSFKICTIQFSIVDSHVTNSPTSDPAGHGIILPGGCPTVQPNHLITHFTEVVPGLHFSEQQESYLFVDIKLPMSGGFTHHIMDDPNADQLD